jgi:hypothetical protein
MDIPLSFAATYYSKVRAKYYRNWNNSDQLFSKAVRKFPKYRMRFDFIARIYAACYYGAA